VGLVARVIEEAGIPTVVVSTGRDLSAQVKAPRTVFVNFPMGNPFGRPFDAAQQRAVLLDALRALESARDGGALIDLPYDWGEDFDMNLGSGYRRADA
jgi:D-proline reductase (dithiol) PrdB